MSVGNLLTEVFFAPEEAEKLRIVEEIKIDRLQEIADAERDGRLVVLPCKVGDTIFSHCWNIKNQKYDVCTGRVKDVRYDAADGCVMVTDGERYRVLGKTVFLTRAEAEAALKGAENERD